jgi:hypothetical protein
MASAHFLFACPKRKWAKSPAVRDPAFRILKAGKKGTEIELRVESRRPHRPTISTNREKVNHLSECEFGRNRNARV